MAFPVINYKYNSLKEAAELAGLVDQKFKSFEKFLRGDESVTCDVEFEKVGNQQNGKVFRIEANVNVDGTLYRAEATEDSFERAVDELRDEIDKEMRRAKDKQASKEKRDGRAAKEQLLQSVD